MIARIKKIYESDENISKIAQRDPLYLIDELEKIFYGDGTVKGIKSLPKGIILDDILQMILRKYSRLMLDEISLALQMDRYGEIPKTEHFQLYNSEYVNAILQKYCEWKRNNNATRLDLSRTPTQQLEYKPDYEKIHQEYRDGILRDIRAGKEHKHINSYLLMKDVPTRFKPTKEQFIEMMEKEMKILKNENYLKSKKNKDSLIAKIELEKLNGSIQTTAKTRVCNIIVCNWLAKEIKEKEKEAQIK